MGKLKAKAQKVSGKGSNLINPKKGNKILSKQKSETLKENKKLASLAKSEMKKENTPPITPSKKRKLQKSDVQEESPKKQKSQEVPSPNKKVKSNKTSEKANSSKKLMSNEDKMSLTALENERKHQQDLRTLYVRFKNKKAMKSESDVMSIHPEIKHTRIFRSRRHLTKKNSPIYFAFIEFGSESEAKKAYKDLSPKSDDFFVDFMGPNSKCKTKKNKADDQSKNAKKKKEKVAAKINPLRLFVNGLTSNVTQSVLHQLFPKASKVVIPRIKNKPGKLSKYAFLEFSNPVDARGAFDASKNLEVNGHHITVLYARYETKSKGSSKKKEETKETGNHPKGDTEKVEEEAVEDLEMAEDDSESDVENDEETDEEED